MELQYEQTSTKHDLPFISRDNYDRAFNVEYYLKENRAQRTTNLSLALNGFSAEIDMKLRYMSFVGHERCPLRQELNDQPVDCQGVVNEQLLPSRMGSVSEPSLS